MDNRIQEYWYALYSTGEDLSGLYYLMLLDRFPKFFKHLPWQKTGKPVSELVAPLVWRGKLTTLRRKTWGKVNRKLNQSHIARRFDSSSNAAKSPKDFVDYNAWLRQDPARSHITRLLSASDALYPDFCDRKVTLQDWENHLNGQDLFDRIGTVFTLELWMQQLFNGRYRDGIDSCR